MNILSIYQSLPSTVSLFQNDRIVAAVSEERFTRNKNDEAFPKESINYCLDQGGIKPENLDAVALASFTSPFEDQLVKKSRWSVADYLTEQYDRWKPFLIDKNHAELKSLLEIFPGKIETELYPQNFWSEILNDDDSSKAYLKNRTKLFSDYLDIPNHKIHKVDHHRAHAYYSYYTSHFRNEPILSLTIDGFGDGSNATVGIFDSNGSYKRIYKTNKCLIARIYRYMTLMLGMKPNEHEYKVMGLAPYGSPKYGSDALKIFRSTLKVKGIEFEWDEKPTDCYFWFKNKLEGIRFDNIAWGLQKWVEELMMEWVKNCIEETKISKVVISGGVANNIKANGKLINLPNLKDLFIGGSPGDDSLSIGSAFCLAEDIFKKNKIVWKSNKVKPLQNLCLGPEPIENMIKSEVKKLSNIDNLKIIYNITSKELAQFLLDGFIIARCVGKMEFGQRALGNRSILADPINLEIKEKINSSIKNRDFWMPFAPIIMDKYVDEYLINPKNINSPHMTIGFETTNLGYESMKAACHPSDRSARPQILNSNTNIKLYKLLMAFEKLSGRGALLNTSFNLHGAPIVNTPKDAIYVFKNSHLDGLLLEDTLIMRK